MNEFVTNLEVVISQDILKFLKEGKSRREVMKEFRLKRTNAYDILVQLEIKGLIYRYPLNGDTINNGGTGRPIELKVKREAGRPVILWRAYE